MRTVDPGGAVMTVFSASPSLSGSARNKIYYNSADTIMLMNSVSGDLGYVFAASADPPHGQWVNLKYH